MKITLIIHSLTYGGAERIMSIMANYWSAKGWQITLLTFDDNKIPDFPLDSRVTYIPLGIAEKSLNAIIGIWNNLKRIRILRNAIINSDPDIVISFMSRINITTLLATRWLNIPVIVSERSNPEKSYLGWNWQKLRKWTYSFADKIVFQTQRARDYFPVKLQNNSCIIPNMVVLPAIKKQSVEKVVIERSLIAMGRFVPEKGFDLLLQAFAKLKDNYPEWTLTILGDGKLRPELECLRNELGLSDRVYFPGMVNDTYAFLQQADIFIMSSRFEGFPNAICEAMTCGLPVISTDCPSGPREIIRDGIDGILVPNEDISALAAAIERLISNEQERNYLAAHAPEITERFSVKKIMEMWEDVLVKVTQKEFIIQKSESNTAKFR
ncbi:MULTISPECIES: glycosyltransferase family 4 protein [Nostoc]|uniref:Glycosyltransferase family 4 protein n=1 Tax=Nostoc paludosum FACHB-159 TaxID=2692908 RepID=A0ABR8K5A1_9NOSO|nr:MULTISPECIES: glycosyltransferase family 4 protein [Nostoc]MBD2678366.1 glycosyltransferase family 4 protein [Nostoc sp. FACHB-857]MBD2733485.1 glycosyltransferase family 4 protein [Nostoc paludosum FACHB-159]